MKVIEIILSVGMALLGLALAVAYAADERFILSVAWGVIALINTATATLAAVNLSLGVRK